MCDYRTKSRKKADAHSWRTGHKINGFVYDTTELARINEIESPKIVGQNVRCTAVISSTSIAYVTPLIVDIEVKHVEGDYVSFPKETIEIPLEDTIKLIKLGSSTKQKVLNYIAYREKLTEGKVQRLEEKSFGCVYWIRVRPQVLSLQFKDGMVLDEKGFEYKAFDVYVLSADKQIAFEPSKLVALEGLVLPEPSQQRITLLATKIEFPADENQFDILKLKALKAKLDSYKTLEAKITWMLEQFSIYSGVVQRANIAFANLLIYFSPLYITFDSSLIRGWGNGLVVGDSTVGKSETSRKANRLLEAGVYLTAETASQAGLTASAVQIEKRGWFVDWGFLVLQDRGLLIIDGAHRLSRVDWSKLAESERTGMVIIAKASKDEAYARTRQIKIANPLDRESWQTEKMQAFLYAAQALPTILDKTNIARLDLAVFARTEDVKIEDVDKVRKGETEKELELLRESLKFCWSSKAYVEFEKEAVQRVLSEATRLYNEFGCEDIPLVSIDTKYKLARLSASVACLTLSVSEDYAKILVKEEHVSHVASFLRTEYSAAGLNVLAAKSKNEAIDSEEASEIFQRIENDIKNFGKEHIREILSFIVLKGHVTKDQLKQEFHLTRDKELQPIVASFRNEGLFNDSKTGLYASPRAIQLYKVTVLEGGIDFSRTKSPGRTSNDNGEHQTELPKAKASTTGEFSTTKKEGGWVGGSLGFNNSGSCENGYHDQCGGVKCDCNCHKTTRAMLESSWHLFHELEGDGQKDSVEDQRFLTEFVQRGFGSKEDGERCWNILYRSGQIYETSLHFFRSV
jgi:transcription initiation factor IIE alpha subunit